MTMSPLHTLLKKKLHFQGTNSCSNGDDGNRQFKSAVYFSSWSVYQRKHFMKDLPLKYLTDVFYAFLAIDSNTGEIKFSDSWGDIEMPLDSLITQGSKVKGNLGQMNELKQLFPSVTFSMSIGGWGSDAAFSTVMSDTNKMNTFVSSAVNLLSKYGFDGIDIDWEYPKNAHEGKLMVDLLRKLRQELDSLASSKRPILTIAAPAGEDSRSNLRMREMDQYLSFWNIMCYDYAGNSWSDKTGFHSNLFGSNGDNELNGSDVITSYLNSGISSRKLVLGMPLYGRKFFGAKSPSIGQKFNASAANGEADIADYKFLPMKGCQEYFDPRKVSASCFDPKKECFVSYDNQQSARIKAKFVESKNLAGGMWWDSAGDPLDEERSLIKNFVDQLGGLDRLEK
ncbi:Piso0_000873 [Millerozyma farinosa CBS 7064]|uniref:chitinase n=1 Tax=Pichia sorbitophila (strain ATCC MYA-4447 / BCRC 22081 / CBS 7064 / NBRC 10061 / NRRL Y-12695) TaxID=559304 RepID=G8YRR8_PICSO|nr:Piso0_000873 [Millerozyma farinosa CBS 7064]